MNVIYRMILDVQHPTRMHTLALKQKDHKSRTIEFSLLDNGRPLDLTDVLFATIKGIKPDGESVIYADAEIVRTDDASKVVYQIDDSYVEAPGRYAMELELLSAESEVLSSFDFHIDVQNQLYDEDDYVSSSDLDGFRSFMVRGQNAAQKAEDIERKFEVAFGSIDTIVADLEGIASDMAILVDDIEDKRDSGYFNGPQGPQGENGHDAVVTEMPGLVSLEIIGADLIATFDDGEVYT